MASLVPSLQHRPVTILLVEDNPGDQALVREALLPLPWIQLWFAPDGTDALRLLEGPGRKPDLILLDLNLPRLDGRALLTLLKNHPVLCRIPTIVMTSSVDPLEIERAYNAHANCYLAKPPDFARMELLMRRLAEFWLEVAELPYVGEG